MRETVAEILRFLTLHFGEDFQSYSQSLAEKRIAERVAQLRLPDVAEYYRLLQRDPSEPSCLGRMLRIRFSSFFRDPLQFELLRSLVIPAMLLNAPKGGAFFRAWSAACAGGEEACSLAIIIDETLQLLDVQTKVQIFATDIAEDALEEARLGRYSPGSLGGVSLQQLNSYFTPEGNGYRICPKILSMITYCRHDLLDPHTYAPPESLFGGFDIVSCRNFLMYLDPEGYLKVFDNLFRALNPGGVLLLGKAESVPERYHQHLERVLDCGNLYRKKQTGRS